MSRISVTFKCLSPFAFGGLSLIGALAISAALQTSSVASIVTATTSSDDAFTTQFAAGRLRWGATGFEVGSYAPGAQGTINYGGAPAWVKGNDYNFTLVWDSTTGQVSMSTSVGAQVAVGTNLAQVGVIPSLIGIRLTANDTQTIELGNLVLNGNAVTGSVSDLVSTAANTSSYYAISGLPNASVLTLTGTFSFDGTANFAQERPVINIGFGEAVVPEASTIAVWSVLSLVGAGVAYRKRAGK